MDDTDDKQLLLSIANGNQGAFQVLMQKYLRKITIYAYQTLKDNVIAEEIAQETFLRVWQKADTWSDQGFSIKSWIYKICYNLCIDFLRKQQKELRLKTESAYADDYSRTEPEPQHHLEYEQIVNMLNKLPERQSTALYLSVFQGLSNMDAAIVMDISVEALESLLARARRKLKALLIQIDSLS